MAFDGGEKFNAPKFDEAIAEEFEQRVRELHPEASAEDVQMAARALAVSHKEMMDASSVPADEIEAAFARRMDARPGDMGRYAMNESGTVERIGDDGSLPEGTTQVL